MASSGDHHQLKTSWPELVGMAALMAEPIIRNERPDVKIEAHFVGQPVPPAGPYNNKRVRVLLNRDALYTVAQTPVVG